MHAPATRSAPSAPAVPRPPDTRELGAQLALVMLVVLAASYVVNAMDRQVFPVLLPNISRDYGFSLAEGGFLSTIFTLGIGIGGIPSGYLLDRFSRKTVIVAGIAIYSVFTATGTWKTPFYVYGLAGLVFVVVILAVVPKLFTERAEESRPGSPSADRMPARPIKIGR